MAIGSYVLGKFDSVPDQLDTLPSGSNSLETLHLIARYLHDTRLQAKGRFWSRFDEQLSDQERYPHLQHLHLRIYILYKSSDTPPCDALRLCLDVQSMFPLCKERGVKVDPQLEWATGRQ